MPRGRAPTGICATSLRLAKSITSTASPSSALTITVLPSGENTACSGLRPLTFTSNTFCRVVVSMNITSLPSSTAAATQRPSAEMPAPSGEVPSGMLPTSLPATRSTTFSAPAGWSVTKAVRASGVTTVPRGFLPAGISATTVSVWVSITLSVPEPSLGT